MLTIKVKTALLNRAIRDFIAQTGKDLPLETNRQAKLLCIELAAGASPTPRGVKRLAASIPKIWGRRIRGQMGTIVKGPRSLGLFALARINDTSVLKNSYYPGKVTAQLRTYVKKYTPAQLRAFERKQLAGLRGKKRAKAKAQLQAGGSELQSTGYTVNEVSALHRIMEASQKNPQSALKNLRQLLKSRLQGEAPTVHSTLAGRAVSAYYDSLKDKAQRRVQGSKKTQKVYILASDPRPEREALAVQIDKQIGTVKAGWIQAGLAIPVKAGPRIPGWLLGKRAVGQGQSNTNGLVTSASILNSVGNAGGVEDRTGYVKAALDTRYRKILIAMDEATKALARSWYKKQRLPVPAYLAPGNIQAANTVDI